MEYIVTFDGTSQAIRAERLLMEAGLRIRVMPLPGQINVGCGICLRVDPDQIDEAVRRLLDDGIRDIRVFEKVREGRRTHYLPSAPNKEEE